MHLKVILGCILILLTVVFPIVRFDSHAAASPSSLNEGAYWTYRISRRTEALGTGSYEGHASFVEDSEGKATVRELNSTFLVIEDEMEVNQSSSGSGFFKQNESVHTSATTICFIDRGTLRVKSHNVRSEDADGEYVDRVREGMPTMYFVSTSLKRGQDAKYFWGGESITCFVDEGVTSLHGSNISVITLRYNGPKKVTIQTVTRFAEDGTAEAAFSFEKSLGLLVSYTVREKAMTKGGSCCAVKTTSSENYTLQSTSLWGAAESSKTQIQPTSPSTPSGEISFQQPYTPSQQLSPGSASQGLLLALLLVVVIIGLGYSVVRLRNRATNKRERLTEV